MRKAEDTVIAKILFRFVEQVASHAKQMTGLGGSHRRRTNGGSVRGANIRTPGFEPTTD